MRAYIIEYQFYDVQDQRVELLSSHISQEGYASLEAAQAFIKRKPGNLAAITPMHYQTEDGNEHYIIHDIRIIEETEAVSPPPPRPYERTRAAVYAAGNRWAIENFNATHG